LIEEALAMHREEDALRSMLLARLAVEVQLRADGDDHAGSLFEQAVAVARKSGDGNALFNALNSKAYFHILGPNDVDLEELGNLAAEVSNPDAVWLGFLWNFRRSLSAGDIQRVDVCSEDFAQVAEQSRLPGSRSVLSAVRGMRALMAARLDEAERHFEQGMRVLERWGRFDPGQMFPLFLGLRREQDRLDEVIALARRGVELFPAFRFLRVNLAQMLLETGHEADARLEFAQLAMGDFKDVPNDTNWLATITLCADICARLGDDASRAQILYDLLLPYAEQVAHFLVLSCYGPVSHYLALLATTMTRYEAAEMHFRSALDCNSKMKASLLLAYTQRDYVRMLLARRATGDLEKAQHLLTAASHAAQSLGLKRLAKELKTLDSVHIQCSRSSRSQVANARETLPASASGSVAEESMTHVFRKEGDFWTISYRESTFRLKDAKGLRYIAYLLAHPRHRIHVYDLIEAVEGTAASSRTKTFAQSENLYIARDIGRLGPMIDARTRAEYGARLRELRAELDEAERTNDLGRSERLRTELEMVSEELSGSSSLGGRARTASGSAERARGLVGKNIRAALERIRHEHAPLGRHFASSISTGNFCAYQPEPEHPISWQL
jgi:tetratricopeptide (TPR) repeat protein